MCVPVLFWKKLKNEGIVQVSEGINNHQEVAICIQSVFTVGEILLIKTFIIERSHSDKFIIHISL